MLATLYKSKNKDPKQGIFFSSKPRVRQCDQSVPGADHNGCIDCRYFSTIMKLTKSQSSFYYHHAPSIQMMSLIKYSPSLGLTTPMSPPTLSPPLFLSIHMHQKLVMFSPQSYLCAHPFLGG